MLEVKTVENNSTVVVEVVDVDIEVLVVVLVVVVLVVVVVVVNTGLHEFDTVRTPLLHFAIFALGFSSS